MVGDQSRPCGSAGNGMRWEGSDGGQAVAPLLPDGTKPPAGQGRGHCRAAEAALAPHPQSSAAAAVRGPAPQSVGPLSSCSTKRWGKAHSALNQNGDRGLPCPVVTPARRRVAGCDGGQPQQGAGASPAARSRPVPSASALAQSGRCFGSSFLCLIPERDELQKGQTEGFALKTVFKN